MKRTHEKPRRTYDLNHVKKLAKNDCFYLTKQAFTDASRLGMNRQSVAAVLIDLESSDFHKSMTERISRNEIYMDVYNKDIGDLALYIKFKINNDANLIITPFKERNKL